MTELYETLGRQSALHLLLPSGYGDPNSAHCDTCLAVTMSRTQQQSVALYRLVPRYTGCSTLSSLGEGLQSNTFQCAH